MRVVLDDLSGAGIVALLTDHVAELRATSPPGSSHALDVDGLREPGVTFWSVLDGETIAGCGAVKELDATHGEIKSMRTAPTHRQRGVGSLVLRHIVAEARARGYTRLSLETGSADFYAPARGLYERHGFTYCEPFDDYVLDPHSVFMTRAL
ncbi:putative acetyltransferase [Herbihabitans rhizosphaerae]|uniref:Putative acetyltransferase n=1 Tax=Herbihabitans rhizosphaerae TaxID=1872711 RepID=A0A4V2EUG4_9PSEU|nr:GNAT family N-acetyltransferase [Herbihabitans rhizosphaerae]RZS44483.1 putative acetyltransferase [Herbihabitans rhizosphaerae]